MATGLYGVGMGGTAISAFTTVPLVSSLGDRAPFLLTAAVLLAYAVVTWLLLADPPGWQPSRRNIVTQSLATMKLKVTWQRSEERRVGKKCSNRRRIYYLSKMYIFFILQTR